MFALSMCNVFLFQVTFQVCTLKRTGARNAIHIRSELPKIQTTEKSTQEVVKDIVNSLQALDVSSSPTSNTAHSTIASYLPSTATDTATATVTASESVRTPILTSTKIVNVIEEGMLKDYCFTSLSDDSLAFKSVV